MSEALLIAVITTLGTAATSLLALVIQSSRAKARSETQTALVIQRVNQLEVKVEKHNGLVERMVAVEQSVKSAHHRLDGRVMQK